MVETAKEAGCPANRVTRLGLVMAGASFTLLTLTISVGTDGSAASVRALLDEVDPDCRAVTRFGVRTATLDDVFLTLTAQESDLPELEASNV